jgi:hypothetical protein
MKTLWKSFGSIVPDMGLMGHGLNGLSYRELLLLCPFMPYMV